jgi:DNA-binding transcriptional LysR family regulator
MDIFKYSQDFARLKQFYFVAKEGGVKKAADKLSLDHSTLSKSMNNLAFRTKTKLFKRKAGGFKLTADGERLYEHVAKMLHENEEFMRGFYETGNEIQGEIKLITTPAFAELELVPILLSFMKQYPKIKISLVTTIEDFDLQNGDVAIRSFMPNRSDLEQIHLHTHHHKLWANAEYLKKHGIPEEPYDLDKHQLLFFEARKDNLYRNSYWINWILNVGNQSNQMREPLLQITSHQSLIQAACQGFGIVQLPEEWVKIKNADLINVLPKLEGPRVEMYFTVPKQSFQRKRVKALYEFLKASFSAS